MIFYFSGTGNSRHAALEIGRVTNEHVMDIAECLKEGKLTYGLKDDEKLGLIFPVYYYGLPTVLTEFISKLQIHGNEHPYVFVVMTCGSSSGGADRSMKKLLLENGLIPNAIHTVPMVDNYVIGYDLSDEESMDDVNKTADERILKIAKSILVKESNNRESSRFDQLLTSVAYPFYLRGRKTKKFFADDRCISCNLCENICPVGAIKMNDDKPQWVLNQCAHCLACIHRCPVEAIQYGESTKKRRRYVHLSMKK